ncbi:HD domain-containing protein [Gemmatimonas sp.]|jgi:putative nucleotidyltransferase with HDIG domain|uniref:HDIG domain-containing metalloprotein n=1 Tax=Gemmatimonas sp. TaxID=1962908 RepID=UPI0037C09F01
MHRNMDERLPLMEATDGARIEGVTCVRATEERTSQRGTTFRRILLGNRHGQFTLNVWQDQMPAWHGIAQGDGVWVSLIGRAGSGGYGPSWSHGEVVRLDDSHPVRDDLLPPCPVPEAELRQRWDALVAQLSAPAQALLAVVLREVTEEDYWRAPAAQRLHHAVAPFGLVWHSCEVAEAALLLARLPRYTALLNTDVLILGGLLHDVGKTLEYAVQPGVGITRAPLAAARYHTTLGVQIVTAAVTRAEAELAAAGTPRWLVDAVLAVIESHHGIREHGSPTAPASAESWVLHAADLVSARLAATQQALETATPLAEPTWYRAGTQYLQAFHEVAVLANTPPLPDAPREAVAPTVEVGEIPEGVVRLNINLEEAR